MPRVSMKPEDMMGQGFFKEGNIEVLKSLCAVYQYPVNAKTGVQSGPFPAVVWKFRQLGEDWAVPDDANEQELAIRIGALDDIRPGQLENPSDLEAEPEDLGSEVGTEGNSIFGEDGARIGFNWPAMVESLKKAGFKPAVIDRIYMPDYKGMKCHLKQVPTGRKYSASDGTEKEATTFVCTKIQTFPYEKKAAGKAAPASKPAGKAASTKATESDPSDPRAVLIGLLASPSATFTKMVPSEKAIKRQVFQLQVAQELIRQKVSPPSMHAQVTGLLKDDEELTAIAAEVGFVVDLEAGTVMFP